MALGIEADAREIIDALFVQAGWHVYDAASVNSTLRAMLRFASSRVERRLSLVNGVEIHKSKPIPGGRFDNVIQFWRK